MQYIRTSLVTQGNQAGTHQGFDPYSGNYSLELSRSNGYLYDHVFQGAATTQRTQGITGHYKLADGLLYTTTVGGATELDTASVKLSVTRWNAITATRDTIGYGKSYLPLIPTYAPFNLVVNYTSNATPDSIFIDIYPTIYENANSNAPICLGGTDCDYLTIDDISVLPEGIVTISVGSSIKLSPNPVANMLNVTLENNHAAMVSITDMMGRSVLQPVSVATNKTLDLSALYPGLYIVVLKTTEGEQRTKIIKL